MVKIYLARGMTGRIKKDVVREANQDKEFIEKAGLMGLCPVAEEGVKPTQSVLQSSKALMKSYWPRDKAMIREANVLFDMSPHLNSEGVKHELGYGRYCLWKPVVRVFPAGNLPISASVSFFEDDFICDSLIEAIEYVYRVHGSWLKRFNWRLRMLNRSLLKWIMFQIMEFK